MWRAFWAWYERTYTLNVSIAFGLLLLQIMHLFWLSGEVVWGRLFGEPLFALAGWHELLIAFVDYTEIPALLSVSLVYINELRQGWNIKSILYLFFLNSQWLHIFWITDEVVAVTLSGSVLITIPLWLAWVAIGIDYLEVPVMVDTGRKFFRAVRERRAREFMKHELRER